MTKMTKLISVSSALTLVLSATPGCMGTPDDSDLASTSSALVAGTVIIGDVNGDTIVDMRDAINLLDYLFQAGDPPVCMQSADVNGDTDINLSDATAILGWFFGGDMTFPVATCVPVDESSNLTCDALADRCPCQYAEPEQEECGDECYDPSTHVCVEDRICNLNVMECEPGEVQQRGCGFGGQQQANCDDECTWGSWGRCEGEQPTECVPGEGEIGGRCERCGTLYHQCSNSGRWGNWVCAAQGECTPGAQETNTNSCGSATRHCTASCEWREPTRRTGGQCVAGARQRSSEGCGVCGDGYRQRTCRNSCEWGSYSQCFGGSPTRETRCLFSGCPQGTYASGSRYDAISCGWPPANSSPRIGLTCTELCGQASITVCAHTVCPDGYRRITQRIRGGRCSATDINVVCALDPS